MQELEPVIKNSIDNLDPFLARGMHVRQLRRFSFVVEEAGKVYSHLCQG